MSQSARVGGYWQIVCCASQRMQVVEIAPAGKTLKQQLAVHEREILLSYLRLYNGSRTKVAKVLGINRVTLFKKMRSHGLNKFPVAD